ncbi:hypothetical protein QBC32DRAFT_216542 [Pseudoneurospora amorphoporcata]|uniref:C2H2-type domain-containing protein n=1 Tax=Pseudoneurospora amorphoporcata TaxID=241081 RepID=A0AAN6NTF3_9PEZI|nr:hypothetical protein QBC32DRAFT_216542 [Pseudoneurospora amorphoporcata]
MSKLEHLRNASRINPSHLQKLVDEYTWRLITSHAPNWFTCPIFKTMLAENRQQFDKHCTPMSFAPNLHRILSSASPPTFDFFCSLPAPSENEKVGGVYAIVLQKKDCPPKLYIGSGTSETGGVRRRLRHYEDGVLLRLLQSTLNKGYTIRHKGLLCWAPIPSSYAKLGIFRLRFVAVEAIITALFHTLSWLPLNSHTPLLECPRGVHPNMTEEELELYNIRRKERARKISRLASRRKRERARARDLQGYLTKKCNRERKWSRKNRTKTAAIRASRHADAIAEQRYYCKLCKRAYPHRRHYERHQLNKMHIEKERLESGGRPRDPLTENAKRQRARAEKNKAAKTFYCTDCDYTAGFHQDLDRHNKSQAHIKTVAAATQNVSGVEADVMTPNAKAAKQKRALAEKNRAAKTFYCTDCDYTAGSKSCFDRHNKRAKHIEAARRSQERRDQTKTNHNE